MENVFNHFYQDYDSWYDTPVGKFFDEVEYEALQQLIEIYPGAKVLEVGCGTGLYSLKITWLGAHLTGIDIAPNMLDQAKAKFQANHLEADFQIMNARSLSFADNSFDRVFSMAAFEFIEDIQAAYNEMYRVTKPGGIIVIGTIQKGSAWQELYTSEIFKDSAFAYANFKTAEYLIALDPKSYHKHQECLFTPPGLDEVEYSHDNELRYQEQGLKGGFVCVQFIK